jgi:hypothetical protein
MVRAYVSKLGFACKSTKKRREEKVNDEEKHEGSRD